MNYISWLWEENTIEIVISTNGLSLLLAIWCTTLFYEFLRGLYLNFVINSEKEPEVLDNDFDFNLNDFKTLKTQIQDERLRPDE